MSCTKWGFDMNYGHKNLPNKWQSSAGFSLYNPDPLKKKSFRPAEIPFYREDLAPRTTSYVERAVDGQNSMSSYGCHRELPWDGSLRSPRNPYPGAPNRETSYVQQPSPAPNATALSFTKALAAGPLRGFSTPRSARTSVSQVRRRGIHTPGSELSSQCGSIGMHGMGGDYDRPPSALRQLERSMIADTMALQGEMAQHRPGSVLGDIMADHALSPPATPRIVRHPAVA